VNKKKALVIDDEQIVLDSVKKILADGDYDAEVTPSGRQGVEWGIQKDYDIALTDIRMPDIGGMVVLRDLKRAKPELPVVIITGYANVRSAVQAMRLGAADYLEKPFTPDELLKSVGKAVKAAASQVPQEQALVHKEEILRVLERAATDGEFVHQLLHNWADALDGFNLNNAEKLALLTGDIDWIEEKAGLLTAKQRRWLEKPLSTEMLRTYGW